MCFGGDTKSRRCLIFAVYAMGSKTTTLKTTRCVILKFERFRVSEGKQGKERGLTSICIFKCCLKFESSVRKMARDSSNTLVTDDTPFFESATHRYCLIALMNISLVRNTGPAFWSIDSRSCRDSTLERSSCDLQQASSLINVWPKLREDILKLTRQYPALHTNYSVLNCANLNNKDLNRSCDLNFRFNYQSNRRLRRSPKSLDSTNQRQSTAYAWRSPCLLTTVRSGELIQKGHSMSNQQIFGHFFARL